MGHLATGGVRAFAKHLQEPLKGRRRITTVDIPADVLLEEGGGSPKGEGGVSQPTWTCTEPRHLGRRSSLELCLGFVPGRVFRAKLLHELLVRLATEDALAQGGGALGGDDGVFRLSLEQMLPRLRVHEVKNNIFQSLPKCRTPTFAICPKFNSRGGRGARH